MGAMAVDLNDMVEVNAVGFRALSNALGDEGARMFVNQFNDESMGKELNDRPRVTASQIADALELAKVQVAEASASVGGGRGNFTDDRHKRRQLTFEEVTARIMRADAAERVMWGVKDFK